MAYDYSELRGRIRAKYGKQAGFAKALGISPSSLSLRLNNQRDWLRTEIERACVLLGVPLAEAHLYFFAPEVVKTQLKGAE